MITSALGTKRQPKPPRQRLLRQGVIHFRFRTHHVLVVSPLELQHLDSWRSDLELVEDFDSEGALTSAKDFWKMTTEAISPELREWRGKRQRRRESQRPPPLQQERERERRKPLPSGRSIKAHAAGGKVLLLWLGAPIVHSRGGDWGKGVLYEEGCLNF